jgi:hypothetical protein
MSASAFCSRGTVRPAVEPFERVERLSVQRPHRLVPDLVLAAHLLGDQLGVPHHLDLAGAELARTVEAEQQRAVLGHVVRGAPEQLRALCQHLARGRPHDAGGRRRAGVAAGAAVDVHDQLHRGGIMQLARDETPERAGCP